MIQGLSSFYYLSGIYQSEEKNFFGSEYSRLCIYPTFVRRLFSTNSMTPGLQLDTPFTTSSGTLKFNLQNTFPEENVFRLYQAGKTLVLTVQCLPISLFLLLSISRRVIVQVNKTWKKMLHYLGR